MKNKILGIACIMLAALLLGAQVYISTHYTKPKVAFPTHAEIKQHDCDTCGCNNKADVLLIIDLTDCDPPVRQTFLCDSCYTDFVVDMAVPLSDDTLTERKNGK